MKRSATLCMGNSSWLVDIISLKTSLFKTFESTLTDINEHQELPPETFFNNQTNLHNFPQRYHIILLLGMRHIHWVAISFFSIRYDIDTIWGFFSRYDTIRYDMRASKKTFFLRNFRRIFGELLEFSAKKDKKIIGFENIEILDMGGSIRYTIRYTKKSDISAFDKFPIR